MKIQTLTLIYKLLQDEAVQADRECKEALSLRHTIEVDGDTLTELQKRRLSGVGQLSAVAGVTDR